MKIRFILKENPNRKDMLDTLDHAGDCFADGKHRKSSLDDFKLEFLGNLSVEDLWQDDDLSGWLEVFEPDDLHDYRGPEWKELSNTWLKIGIPPIIVVTIGNGHTTIGDGRGRVNFANANNMSLPVYMLHNKA